MKFTLTRASEWFPGHDFHNKVEINSIEDLKALQDKEKHPLIVDFQEQTDGCPTIIVYDDYME